MFFSRMMPKLTDLRRLRFAICLGVVTFLAYLPAINGGWVWDDSSWTTGIVRLLKDFHGLETIWSDPAALPQYYPLTGTSFWIDYHLWKFWTLPYHLENIILHVAAVMLFWQLLERLEVPGAWLAAGIFALHPVMVESVAWITERKNVLSLVFYLASLLAYGKFAGFWGVEAVPPIARRRKRGGPRRKWGRYWLALGLFLAALLAKSTAFSLPAVFLVIAWWRRGSLREQEDVTPTLPFFAIGIGMSALMAWLEVSRAQAPGEDWGLGFPERSLIAGHAFWFYLGHLFWPANLCFIYPRWDPDGPPTIQWIYLLAFIALVLVLWLFRREMGRAPLAVILLFVGTLFPVLGFVNVYNMRYSFVWDHWVYLSSPAIFALAAGTADKLAQRLGQARLLAGMGVVLLPLLAFLTWSQCRMYANLTTLWRTTMARNPAAFLAYNNYGYLLLQDGKTADAIPYFQKSLAIAPGFFEARNNLGNARLRQGRAREAIVWLKAAAEQATNYASVHYNLGNAFRQAGQMTNAVAEFTEALKLKPHDAAAENNLGAVLMQLGRDDDALEYFQNAVADDPGDAVAYDNMGHLLANEGQNTGAMEQYQRAIQLNANDAEANCELANLLAASPATTGEAILFYEHAIKIRPDYVEAQYNLAVLLGKENRLDEAVAHFHAVITLEPNNADAHGNLGNVLVGQNRLDAAVAEYQITLRLHPNSAQAHFRLGEVFQKQNKRAAAIEEYRQTLKLEPAHPEAWQRLRDLGAPTD